MDDCHVQRLTCKAQFEFEVQNSMSSVCLNCNVHTLNCNVQTLNMSTLKNKLELQCTGTYHRFT